MPNASEIADFELLCDLECVSTDERRNIVEDLFGTTAAQHYSDDRCLVMEYGGHRRPGIVGRANEIL